MSPATPVFPSHRDDFAPPKEVVFAKDQPQYIPLPAVVRGNMVTTRWKLTWTERLEILLHGDLWVQMLTFRKPLQPIMLHTYEPQL